MKLAQKEVISIRAYPKALPARILAHTFTLAAARLKVFWRSAIWRSLVRRARNKRKTLAVRETAALGDRRFVSVIQFEGRRFLIGSSPSSVTLLSQLPDESNSGEQTEDDQEKRREQSTEESGGKN